MESFNNITSYALFVDSRLGLIQWLLEWNMVPDSGFESSLC